MVKNIARTLEVLVLVVAVTPFLACNLLQDGPQECADPTANPAVFADPDDATFCTSAVRDVDGEIVQFDTSAKSILWAADGTAYQEGLWDVDGVFLADGQFQVRFGTEGGERRAYFTETGPATICQIEVLGENLFISATNVTVPQE